MTYADPFEAQRMILAGTAPDGLSVVGSLYLRGTAITALPDGLSVSGWLDLSVTAITALPEGLSVDGPLYLEGTAIPVVLHDTERGFELRRVMCGSAEWWVAGCRVFRSRAEALAHWGAADYPDPERGDRYCEAIRNTPEMGDDA